MRTLKARMTRGLTFGSRIEVHDNSGAKVIRLFAVIGHKTQRGQYQSAGIGDLIMASVVKGRPDIRKQVVYAVIVRQRRPFRRPDGTSVIFEDNAAVVLKDDKKNPRGTLFKGPMAKEIVDRWPAVSKLGTIIV